MTLYLLRHGRTAANEAHLYCGRTDIALSADGEAGLRRLRASGVCPPLPQNVYTSGMRRCDQTLRILYGDVPFRTLPGLREMDFGRFEMKSYEQLRDDPAYLAWIAGDNEANAAPGGESGRIMEKRAFAELDRLAAAGGDALVVTHGGVIAAAMARWFPGENRNRYQWQPDFGRGYAVVSDGGRASSYKAI